MRKVYLLPNLFTTASLFCGLLSIIHIYGGEYDLACWLILVAAFLDWLDGRIARFTRTQSSFGVNYDSLADLVAFGVAPAMLIFTQVQSASGGGMNRIAVGVSVLYAICGALRLARFNVQVSAEEKKAFTGLPIPAAAGAVVATFLLLWRVGAVGEGEGTFILRIIPIPFVILSYLMVSNLHYPSLKNMDFERRKPFDYLVSVAIIVCFIVVMWQMRTFLIFFGFWSYVLSGILGRMVEVHRDHRRAVAEISGGE